MLAAEVDPRVTNLQVVVEAVEVVLSLQVVEAVEVVLNLQVVVVEAVEVVVLESFLSF